jgi:hypothetical protein
MLRLNAVATYRVADAHKALSATDDARQALYREAQLALRAVIGGRERSSPPGAYVYRGQVCSTEKRPGVR